ncbi:MAG: T9SS type A sorting domain-containing protein [Sphingobacteriales bacterium]|nr:MAG: T9SS type A sorting domain-containing protein [Sphingobacteriales bacterium]
MVKNLYTSKHFFFLLCLSLIAGIQQTQAAPYCTPATGTVFASAMATNVITSISVPYTGLSSAMGTNSNGYTSVVFAGSNPKFHQGSTYVVNANVASAGDVAAWIDFNRDSTFQNVEMVPMTISGTTAVGMVTVPATASLGTTRLRIMGAASPNILLGPCGNTTRGEAEDYLIEIIVPTTCAAPSALTSTGVISTWGKMKWTGTASSYDYALGTTKKIPTTVTNTTADSAVFTGLTGGSKYYFYVRSICGNTDFSEWALDSFTTPVCIGPAFSISNITDSSVMFSWTAAPGAIATEYALNTNATGPNGAWGPPPTPATLYKITGLLPNKLYYVHMRSICPGNDSSAWRTGPFSTTNLSVSSIHGGLATCYPNPVRGELNVVLAKDAEIVLYDLSGREFIRTTSADNKAVIDMRHYDNGIYFLKCISDQQSSTMRILKEN